MLAAVRRKVWIPALAALALALCYAPVVAGLARHWWDDEDMSHGFLVPLCIAWVVWRDRDQWRTLAPRPSAWGFALLLAGAAAHLASAGGAGLFAGAVALVVSAAGAVLALGGAAYLRAWAFPLALTVFLLPKLAVVYNQTTLPLQLAATRLAALLLRLAGLAVTVNGNILEIAHRQVVVEEACNGLRFLLSLGLLAVMFAWLYDRRPWMRWALLAAIVPVAVGANAVRVAGAAWLASIDPAYAEGWFHLVSGAFVFAVSLPALSLLHRAFSRIHAGRAHP